MSKASIRARFVMLDAVTPDEVPNGAVFIDSTNGDTISTKSVTGMVSPVQTANDSIFIKKMISFGEFPLKSPIAKRPDGRIEAADSDTEFGQNFIGYALRASTGTDQEIEVLLAGPNIPGAIAGFGFLPGQTIYMAESGGEYTNNPDSFTHDDDAYIKVGVADVPAGEIGFEATDLIGITQLFVSP